MQPIAPALQSKLDAGLTTLCRSWIVRRRDGVVLGFTDHDRDLVVAGVTCAAASGLSASEATAQFGLAVTGSEIAGAFSDTSLTEADLAAGRYDAAEVDIYLVDWSDPTLAILLTRGVFGEVKREGTAFTAELRSLTHRLAEESGRLFTATCAADLGDARCRVDLNDPRYRGSGSIVALPGSSILQVSGVEAFAAGWFTAGKISFTSGANAGLAVEVKSHRTGADGVVIELWQQMPEPLAIGDTFAVTAGCDKRFATCRDRFGNTDNFRGFPHIPGNDFIIGYPAAGEPGLDGTSSTGWQA